MPDKIIQFLIDALNYLLKGLAIAVVTVMGFLHEFGTVYGHGLTWLLCTFVIPILPYIPGGGWILDFLLGLLYGDTWQRVFVISLLGLATWRYVRQRPFFNLHLTYGGWRIWRGLRGQGPPPGGR